MIYNGRTDDPVRDAELYELEQEAKAVDWRRFHARHCMYCEKVIEDGEYSYNIDPDEHYGCICKDCYKKKIEEIRGLVRGVINGDFLNYMEDAMMEQYYEIQKY